MYIFYILIRKTRRAVKIRVYINVCINITLILCIFILSDLYESDLYEVLYVCIGICVCILFFNECTRGAAGYTKDVE